MGAILWAAACGDPTEPNREPMTVGSIPARSVFIADTVEVVVSGYFSDSDGDALSHSAQSSDAAAVSVTASADTVRVAGSRQGTAIVTVTANDPGGLSATQSFSVTVPNRAPEAADSIPAVETHIGQGAPVVASAYFSDPSDASPKALIVAAWQTRLRRRGLVASSPPSVSLDSVTRSPGLVGVAPQTSSSGVAR